MATFEEQYEDVLQNIESAIVAVYRNDPGLVDFDVERALNALISGYAAELRGREPAPVRLNERANAAYGFVKSMCEWRLGRENPFRSEDGKTLPMPKPIRTDEIVACLKRTRKSLQRWSKEGGRQGYLEFVKQFLS